MRAWIRAWTISVRSVPTQGGVEALRPWHRTLFFAMVAVGFLSERYTRRVGKVFCQKVAEAAKQGLNRICHRAPFFTMAAIGFVSGRSVCRVGNGCEQNGSNEKYKFRLGAAFGTSFFLSPPCTFLGGLGLCRAGWALLHIREKQTHDPAEHHIYQPSVTTEVLSN